MHAEQQVAVFDGVEPDVGWDAGRTAAVPAGAMTAFGTVRLAGGVRLTARRRMW